MHIWCCFHHHGWHGLPPIGGGGWVGNTQAPQLPQQLKISALEHLVSATITMPASLITKLTNTCFGPKSYFWLFDFTFPCWSSSSMLSWGKVPKTLHYQVEECGACSYDQNFVQFVPENSLKSPPEKSLKCSNCRSVQMMFQPRLERDVDRRINWMRSRLISSPLILLHIPSNTAKTFSHFITTLKKLKPAETISSAA